MRPFSRHTEPPNNLLRNRNFVLLWCAYGISAMGDHLSEMAILKTQGALGPDVDITPLNARMMFTFFVSFFFLAPLTGLLADRLPRRGIMITADVARVAIMAGFGLLIGLTQDWGNWGPFWPLLLVGGFAALFSPARSAMLPTIIRPNQLVRANGLISGLGIMGTMVAVTIGGYLADYYDPKVAFRLDALTFLLSAACLCFLRLPRNQAPPTEPTTRQRPFRELLQGIDYVRHHRHVRELIGVAAIVWFCGSLVQSVVPAIVRDVYGGTYSTISYYRALTGLGLVLGAVIISVLGNALRGEIAITWGLFGLSVGIGIMALSTYLGAGTSVLMAVGAVGVVVTGLTAAVTMASFNALLQRTVANRFRGRVFGIKDLATVGALLVATGLLGVPDWQHVDRWVGLILIVVAGITLLSGFVTLHIRLDRGPLGKGLTFAQNINDFWSKFWWRLQRIGVATVPRRGAVIITANHTCPADPLFLSASAPYRLISFMVAAEYSNLPIVRFFLGLVDCIPVKRDGHDTAATKKALRHLRQGKALGVFIEGRIVKPGETVEPKDGVAMLALKTGAAVIPAHISGIKYHDGILIGLLDRHRARVRFGPPVDLSEFCGGTRDDIRAASRKIYAAIQQLAPSDVEGDGDPSARRTGEISRSEDTHGQD